MLPTLVADPRVELVAAADPRPDATQRFSAEFNARGYATIEELCKDGDVEVVYVATPHQYHSAHAVIAAQHGKHVLVEKPMAISIEQCRRMIDAAERTGVVLIIGHSHSFDRPIQRARELIAGGAFGPVRMISAQYYTDFLYRPRRAEELETKAGGGVVFSQGAHQVDIVRLLGGGRVSTVRAFTAAWDPARPTEGAYAALLNFADGAFASLVYSGYGHFDGDEFCLSLSELGREKEHNAYGGARRRLRLVTSSEDEAALKQARNYGGADLAGTLDTHAVDRWHEHFGLVLVSCERADLRPMPNGVMVYDDNQASWEPLAKPLVPRAEVIDELYAAIVDGQRPLHDGRWAMATLEVCLAMLQSVREGGEIVLQHQLAVPGS
jgi:phthalate 4,5-cis-dihydrodiol dehydrogenase